MSSIETVPTQILDIEIDTESSRSFSTPGLRAHSTFELSTMWPIWILLLFAAPAFRLVSSVFSFAQNYRAANKMGLPIVSSPVYSRSLPWLVLSPLIGPLLLKLPFGLGSWVRYNRYMWAWEEKASAFQEKGKLFVVVSPAKLQVRQIYRAKRRKGGDLANHDSAVLCRP